jgi:hypothetical protein
MRQVRSSREVLPQQQIRIFVRATLPGTLRIAEVDLHICGYRKFLVLRHLQSTIQRQRASQRSGKFTNMPTQGHLTKRVCTIFEDYPKEVRLLPIGSERLVWNRKVLQEKDVALEAANQRFRNQIFDSGWSLIERFAEPDGKSSS